MKWILLTLAMLFVGCAHVTSNALECTSVPSVIQNAAVCSGRVVRIEAHLISTRHGAYMADGPDELGQTLGVEIIESGPHAEAAAAIAKRLDQAQLGHPVAKIIGVFEGSVDADSRGVITIKVFREVH